MKKTGKEKQEVDLRVRKYLEGKPMPVDEMITRNMNLCVVDTEKVTILKHPWSKIINMCDVDELINYDIQQQILLMKKKSGLNMSGFIICLNRICMRKWKMEQKTIISAE